MDVNAHNRALNLPGGGDVSANLKLVSSVIISRERVVDSSCNRGHVTLNEPGRSSDSEAAPTAD